MSESEVKMQVYIKKQLILACIKNRSFSENHLTVYTETLDLQDNKTLWHWIILSWLYTLF